MQMGPNGRGMMPPTQGMPPNMIPQQLRGPPSPPYNHQPVFFYFTQSLKCRI